MIKLLTPTQIKQLDAATISEKGILSIDLMETAAAAAAHDIMETFGPEYPFIVFAGPGNNGGDALAISRMLIEAGYHVSSVLFNISGKLSPDCQTNRDLLCEIPDVEFVEVTSKFEPPRLDAHTIVIDGLFGTGLSKPLSGGFASLVKLINDSEAYVISIDVPSGLSVSGHVSVDPAKVIHADRTLVFHSAKLTMLLADTADFWGQKAILPLDLSEAFLESIDSKINLLQQADVAQYVLPRPKFAHKGTFGHALLIAGKYGMAGAAILSAKACLRSGVGKVTVHSPQMNNSILQISVPEAIVSHDTSDTIFTAAVRSRTFEAVAVGPGIGTDRATSAALIEQLTQSERPMVIDADALNILAERPTYIGQIPPKSILTPHMGEFRRLCHRENLSNAEALAKALEFAAEHDVYVILKGHHSAICTPEGYAYLNDSGNSGMGTAGSGDVLTGILAALLAQGYSPLAACFIGVFVHGLAGDLAASSLSEEGTTASDIIDYLPAAFRQLRTIW